MMERKKSGTWNDSTDLARAILYDRTERRKWLCGMSLAPLAMLVLGIWVIDAWIWDNVWRVLIWWGGCAFLTVLVILFALFDMLVVVREERAKKD